jgi:TonB family protein
MGSAQGQVPSEVEQARTAPEFGAHTPLSEKLLAVAIRAQNFTGSTGVAIALAEGDQMVCRANWGTSAPEVGATLSLENSFTGLCVRTGEPLRCDNAQSDPRVDPEACQALGISAIAAAPVRRGLKVIGVIAAFSDTPSAFTDKQLLILTTLADVVVELLDDPHPIQPLPQVVEAPDPELARAEAVMEASILPLVDKASVPTTVLREPAALAAQEDLIAVPSAPATLAQPEPPGDAPPPAAAEATSDAPQPPQPEPALPTVIASSRPPATPASAKPDGRESPRRVEALPKKDEVLPAAMDPGPPLQPAKTAVAGTAGSARLALIKLPQPASVPAPAPTPTPAPVPDFVADLRFTGVEADAGSDRRWLLPVAILVIFAILAFAVERWHVATKASRTKAVPAAQAPEPRAAPAPPSELTQPEKPAEPTLVEPKHSPFSPPPIKEAVPPPAKKARPADPPADVTIHHDPQPVVEVAGPLRRPKAAASKTEVPEAQAPQLALSAPDLPEAVAKPAASAVVAPVSRFVPARVVQRVAPVYPETARRVQLSGKVVVKATITKSGSVSGVQWVSGNELFRDSALAAVKQWHCQPANLNGKPIESDLEIVLQFHRPIDQ